MDKVISVVNMRLNPSATTRDDDYLLTYNVMRIGDIAFEGSGSKLFAHGRFVENDIGDGIVSHVFEVLKPISPRWPRPPSWQLAERDHGCDGLDEERILEVLRGLRSVESAAAGVESGAASRHAPLPRSGATTTSGSHRAQARLGTAICLSTSCPGSPGRSTSRFASFSRTCFLD